MIRLKLLLTFMNIDRTATTDWWTRFFHNPIYHIKLYNECAADCIKFGKMVKKYGPDIAYGMFQAYGLENIND